MYLTIRYRGQDKAEHPVPRATESWLVQLNKRALCRPRYYQPKYHEIYELRLACTKRYHLHVRRSSAIVDFFFLFPSFELPRPSFSSASYSCRTRSSCPRPDKKEIGASSGTIRPSRAPISDDTSRTVFGMPCEIAGKNQYRYDVAFDKPFTGRKSLCSDCSARRLLLSLQLLDVPIQLRYIFHSFGSFFQ